VEKVADIFGVLLPEGTVEMVLGEELEFDGLGHFTLAGEGAPRRGSQQQEGEGYDAEKDAEHCAKAAGEKDKHGQSGVGFGDEGREASDGGAETI
jgi:hypothetical protein